VGVRAHQVAADVRGEVGDCAEAGHASGLPVRSCQGGGRGDGYGAGGGGHLGRCGVFEGGRYGKLPR
jgi:hypothetical protein